MKLGSEPLIFCIRNRGETTGRRFSQRAHTTSSRITFAFMGGLHRVQLPVSRTKLGLTLGISSGGRAVSIWVRGVSERIPMDGLSCSELSGHAASMTMTVVANVTYPIVAVVLQSATGTARKTPVAVIRYVEWDLHPLHRSCAVDSCRVRISGPTKRSALTFAYRHFGRALGVAPRASLLRRRRPTVCRPC